MFFLSFPFLSFLFLTSPFERNESENNQIYEILMRFDEFKELFPPDILQNEALLKKLCTYAVMETVSFADTPGLHLF